MQLLFVLTVSIIIKINVISIKLKYKQTWEPKNKWVGIGYPTQYLPNLTIFFGYPT